MQKNEQGILTSKSSEKHMYIFHTEKVKVEDINLFDYQPKKDDILIYLWEQALAGKTPVYFAAIPLQMIEPFDKEYDPRKLPIGKKAIEAIMENWRNNKFQYAWVYPRDDKFILSDDYMAYYAALTGQPDFVPCLVLGKPENDAVKDVQGPIVHEEIRRLIFG